ncbi:DUF63 family protein [Natronocalculus amylovorans]|uniref:DUF63 family protein n=1 Tax=Natronocalculus amylovorans TaxID=2917812 RepID=A0AAE3K864_9EURY|nr:DUF63 family protein [Natronocalculus amylovorans]MCL9816190.1 DUF63 family protein [Natronocalculus amylovorans]
MAAVSDRLSEDPEALWGGTVLALLAALIGGSALFPQTVYDGFVWKYFWGPVVADGAGASCAVRSGGETSLLFSLNDCATATGVVAEPGYTTISTLSYALILVLMLVGIVFLIRRLDIGDEPGLFFALFPFMLFGGSLRTVEDVGIALGGGAEALIPFPWSAFLISPFIYFTVFLITLIALLISVGAERQELVSRYEYPLAAIGSLAFGATLVYYGYVAATTEVINVVWAVPIITLGGATVITAITWYVTQNYAPHINAGTGFAGAIVVWGHTVDGVANVLSLDWSSQLGIPNYSPKHVVNGAIIDLMSAVQPASVSAAIGTAWPFLFVKVGAALFVVWLFEPEMFEESPRYSWVLLIAVLAVGLGPGTRDFLRATLGV